MHQVDGSHGSEYFSLDHQAQVSYMVCYLKICGKTADTGRVTIGKTRIAQAAASATNAILYSVSSADLGMMSR